MTKTYTNRTLHDMPELGRWNGIDQLAENYVSFSPYAYVMNNPISLTDPDGRIAMAPQEAPEINTPANSLWWYNRSLHGSLANYLGSQDGLDSFRKIGGSGGGGGSTKTSTPADIIALVNSMIAYGGGSWTNTGSGFSNMSSQKSLDYFGIELKEFIIPEVVLTGNSSTWGKQIQNHVNTYINQWNTEKASSTVWASINKGLAGFGFGNGIKNQMMDYAIRGKFSDVEFKALNDFGQNRKLLETLGKGGTKYLKYAKNLGTIAEIGNVLYSGYQMYNNPTAGNSTRLAVQGIAIGTAFIPGVGWAISLGIGTADAIWGDQLYNWIDNH